MSSLQQLSVSGVVDSSRSVMLVMCTVSCNFPHAVIYWIQMWQIWRTQLRGINSEISFCNSSTVAWAQWAFQVLQGSVETLFRWGGKHLTSFCNKFIQETVYQISSALPKFIRPRWAKAEGFQDLDRGRAEEGRNQLRGMHEPSHLLEGSVTENMPSCTTACLIICTRSRNRTVAHNTECHIG